MHAGHIPKGYHSITPYLTVRDAPDAIRFYQLAFGANEVMRFESDGVIAHAELQIGDSRVMLAEESPSFGTPSPATLGGSPGSIHLYVEDVDRVFADAVAAGAKPEGRVRNQFYGDRCGTLVDPYGHRWTIATRVDDVSMDEMQRRFRAFINDAARTTV